MTLVIKPLKPERTGHPTHLFYHDADLCSRCQCARLSYAARLACPKAEVRVSAPRAWRATHCSVCEHEADEHGLTEVQFTTGGKVERLCRSCVCWMRRHLDDTGCPGAAELVGLLRAIRNWHAERTAGGAASALSARERLLVEALAVYEAAVQLREELGPDDED